MRAARRIAATAFALALAAGAAAQELDALFADLRGATDAASAWQVEQRIWSRWVRSGDERVDAVLTRGVAAMEAGELERAVADFSEVIEIRPQFAEGWNKRATAYYLMGEMERSVSDIGHTLALEPRHFGALSGMGLIFIARGDLLAALDAFREVLRIHPQSVSARMHVERLEALLKGRVT